MDNQIYATRKYNGVNHDVSLYCNETDYTVNRKEQYFLVNQDATPTDIIRQARPLSVQNKLIPTKADMHIFLPKVVDTQIDVLPNPYDYDIIIVSSRYAEMAIQTQGNNPDYLDRLYTTVPLYDQNPYYANKMANKIGCVGFRKVWYPRTPQDYVLELHAGRLPSITSMKNCLEIYNRYRAYYDFNTASYLRELENYISTIYPVHQQMKYVY